MDNCDRRRSCISGLGMDLIDRKGEKADADAARTCRNVSLKAAVYELLETLLGRGGGGTAGKRSLSAFRGRGSPLRRRTFEEEDEANTSAPDRPSPRDPRALRVRLAKPASASDSIGT